MNIMEVDIISKNIDELATRRKRPRGRQQRRWVDRIKIVLEKRGMEWQVVRMNSCQGTDKGTGRLYDWKTI